MSQSKKIFIEFMRFYQILGNNFDGEDIKVLSLGCGFGPDAYALEEYIKDIRDFL